MSVLLEIADLSFGYASHPVGARVSFAVASGEIFCLLGPNGGGKTTLFKTVLGLLPPAAGRVLVEGQDMLRWEPERRARAFGYVPQSGAGQFPFTVFEMVLMGRIAHRGIFAAPGDADREAAERALAQLGIAGLADRDWLRISGGERQLALIARALAQAPRILVLDEPTANLDFGNQIRVLEEIRNLAGSGLAVLFSTHHPEQAFACASRVAVLHGGTLARLGTPDEVITAETMRLVYGVDVDILPVDGARMKLCLPHSWREAGP